VASIRLDSTGKGESAPVASNDSASGRQMNRRVEVIIRTTARAQ
jgi:outer membrane protein OmpA-like peptidoglycan-associated protein